jgi:hypothetical protein
MKWSGMTLDQHYNHLRTWRRKFALFPMQMDSGHWVWLESYFVRLNDSYWPSPYTQRALEIPADPTYPPPPPKR